MAGAGRPGADRRVSSLGRALDETAPLDAPSTRVEEASDATRAEAPGSGTAAAAVGGWAADDEPELGCSLLAVLPPFELPKNFCKPPPGTYRPSERPHKGNALLFSLILGSTASTKGLEIVV